MQSTIGRRASRGVRLAWWKLREALSGRTFDSGFYLGAYPDVADAVADGNSVVSAFHHYAVAGAGEGRLATKAAVPPIDLTSMPTTSMVYLELTTRCNLRCVYCPVSQPDYWNVDFDLERLDTVISALVARRVQVVQINGHGESSIVRDWEAIADRLIDAGFRVHIVTNLAKRLSPSEIAALSRFELILVSIDTVDTDLLPRLRRGANVQTIFDNLESIRAHAAKRHRKPELAISCVVSQESAPTIGQMVDEFMRRGVMTFRFGDLVEYPPVEGAMVAHHLSNASEKDLDRVGAQFRDALARIVANGGLHHVDPPLMTLLIDRSRSSSHDDLREGAAYDKRVHHDIAAEGQTRDCLDPWQTAYIHATGAIRPCCFYETHLGMLDEQSLDEIYEGDAFRDLRRAMLDGNLPSSCATCHARPLIDRDAFRRKVSEYVTSVGAQQT